MNRLTNNGSAEETGGKRCSDPKLNQKERLSKADRIMCHVQRTKGFLETTIEGGVDENSTPGLQ